RDGDGMVRQNRACPRLWQGSRDNSKATWDELGAYWTEQSPAADGTLTPIHPLDELDETVTDAQVTYLRALIQAGEQTVIDSVRAWNKAPALMAGLENIQVIHLIRPPKDWVSAHLLPSGQGTWRKSLADKYRRRSFFSRRGFYNNWQYEEIIDAALATRHSMWRAVQPAPEALATQPAYIKLLAFWWAANHKLRQSLAPWRSGATHTLTLPDFTASPGKTMASLYQAANWSPDHAPLDYDHVRSTRPAWQSQSAQWTDAADYLGIPRDLMTNEAPSAVDLERAFDRTLQNVD
ncbi:MAG: hypothetical protein AAGJ29_08185, partial [Pseudomonadota bacterium]